MHVRIAAGPLISSRAIFPSAAEVVWVWAAEPRSWIDCDVTLPLLRAALFCREERTLLESVALSSSSGALRRPPLIIYVFLGHPCSLRQCLRVDHFRLVCVALSMVLVGLGWIGMIEKGL